MLQHLCSSAVAKQHIQSRPARCCGCRCVLGRWANRFSSSLVALSLYSIILYSLLFFALYSTNDTAAEVQLCAQWFALLCLAPPLLSVSLCLTRSSVHKVAVHLSARREGSYRQTGERTPNVQGHRGGKPNRLWCPFVSVINTTFLFLLLFSRRLVLLCTEEHFSVLSCVLHITVLYGEYRTPDPPHPPSTFACVVPLHPSLKSSFLLCHCTATQRLGNILN